MKKILMLSLASVVASAAFPSTGAAATSHNALLVAGPINVRAYRMYLLATPAHPHQAADLTVMFQRGTENDRQVHYYGFEHGVSVKIARDGRSASIKAQLGAYGQVNLTFSPGAGGGTLPAGCNGATVGQHPGHLAGPHGFALTTGSAYFGTVRETSLPAFITTVNSTLTCKPKPSPITRGVTMLSTTATQPSAILTSFTISRSARGFIMEDVLVIDAQTSATSPAILHSIEVSALPASAFTFPSDLSAAHALGAGTFLSGSVDFTRTMAVSPDYAIGTAAGSLTAHFDGIGDVLPETGVDSATLGR